MRTEQITVPQQIDPGPEPAPAQTEDDERALRELARKQAERMRSFRLNVLLFVVANLIIGAVWVVTEYQEEHTWPSRFADSDDRAGTWSPWFFWVLGIWAVLLAVDALKTYGHRPPTEAQIQRELDRLRPRT